MRGPLARRHHAAPVADSLLVVVNSETLDDGWTVDVNVPALVFDVPPEPNAEIRVRYEVVQP